MRPRRAVSANSMRPGRRAALCLLTACLLLLLSCASPEKRLEQADELRHRGQHAAAMAVYGGLIAATPPHESRRLSSAYVGYGQSLWALERREEAVAALLKAVESDPGNADAHLKLAEAFYGVGALGPALHHAELALRLDDGNLDALTVLGQAYAAAGQLLPARTALQQVHTQAPGRSAAAITLARVYTAWRQTELARQTLKKTAAASPNAADVLLALGALEEQEGNEPQAEEAYRRAVTLEGTSANRLRLAQFLQRSSRIAEAEHELRQAAKSSGDAATLLADFELARGRSAQALQSYITHRGQDGRERIAPRAVESAVAAAAASAGVAQRDAWLTRARALLEEHRPSLDAASLAVLEAEIALASGDAQRARFHAATAVKLAPASAPAHYVMGMALERSGQEGAARTSWREAVARDTGYVPAHIMLAASLAAREPATAVAHGAAAARAEPGNLDALLVYARALWAHGRHAAAQSIGARALALNPRSPAPYLLLGEMALAEERFADALIKFRQAVLLGPHSRAAIEGLTRVYRAGDISRPMLRKMETLAENHPPSATLMEIVGRLHAERGWTQDAERCLQRALALDPQSTTAALALTTLYARARPTEAGAGARQGLHTAAALLLEGARAQKNGQPDIAIARYEAAVRAGEQSGVAANNLAWLYAERGEKLDRALYLARSARELDARNPAILDTLGYVLLKRGEFSEAVAALEEASRLAQQPGSPRSMREQVRAHLAEAYRRSGQSAQATAVADEMKPARPAQPVAPASHR